MSNAVVKAVVGLRQYGKSTHVVTMTRACRRIVFYDSLNDDYNQGVVCRNWRVFKRLWKASYRGNFRITYKPEDPLETFPAFCRLAFVCGDMTAVVDEVQLYFNGAFCCPEFTRLITAGGHPGVELIGVTQAPKRLGELLRSQAHEWHVFGLREKSHVDYIAERCPGLDRDLILTLPKLDYVHYVDGADCYWRCRDDPATGTVRKVVMAYGKESPASRPRTDSGEHAAAGDSLERGQPDGPSGLPAAQPAGDPPAQAGPGALPA
jgi:hypothetical protein